MSTRKPEDNLWFQAYLLCAGFFSSLGNTLAMISDSAFRKEKRIRKMPANHFLSSLHFFLHQFPKSFWKFPTGIGIGRSVGTVLLYFFGKRRYFSEVPETPADSRKGGKAEKSGFTLVEMMISVTLFSGILLAAFASFGNIAHFKNKIVSDVDVYEQLYLSVENLATIIKDGGDIDYEEYFNRSVLGTALSGWHYVVPSGFGNYGEGGIIGTTTFWNDVYLCRSSGTGTAETMASAGCALSGALNERGISQSGSMQRYGEYKLQFFDYNSRGNNDEAICVTKGKPAGMPLGDQDCDGSIAGDNDDESLGLGPTVFPKNVPLPELYLINKSTVNPTRLMLRLKIERDPDAPVTAPCITAGAGTGSGCIGRLQMLRLIGKDLGIDHAKLLSTPAYDGKIDTWECQPEFPCTTPAVQNANGKFLPTGADGEWIDVFSKDISVNSAQFFLSPNLDYSLAWKDTSDTLGNSYLRMRLSLGYSWKKRKLIKLGVPEVNITTTLNLRK